MKEPSELELQLAKVLNVLGAAREYCSYPDGITLELKPPEEQARLKEVWKQRSEAKSRLREAVRAL